MLVFILPLNSATYSAICCNYRNTLIPEWAQAHLGWVASFAGLCATYSQITTKLEQHHDTHHDTGDNIRPRHIPSPTSILGVFAVAASMLAMGPAARL
jgi:phage tail sheath gpL-like